MRKSKLVLITGGKLARGGGGGGPPPTSRSRRGGRRPNPLNQLLWYATSRAIYGQRATSVENIAERMTRLSNRVLGRHISVANSTASDVILDCRRRRHNYGWTLMHVEKGSIGFHRGYVTMLIDLTDQDEELYLIDSTDLDFVVRGLTSSLRTTESMMNNDADGIMFTINVLNDLGNTAGAARLALTSQKLRNAATIVSDVRREVEAL